MLKRLIKVVLVILVIGFVLIQFVPVAKSNPPVTMTVIAPEPVMAVLRRSCFDCHSNETIWPWYSRVAPVSWLVAKDVREGRKELNFSEWDRYSATEQADLMGECVEEVAEGEMPMWIYLLTHRNAGVSASELQTLRTWAAGVEHAAESGAENSDATRVDDD